MVTPLRARLALVSRVAALGIVVTGTSFVLYLVYWAARARTPPWERSVTVLLADPAFCALAASGAVSVCACSSSLVLVALLGEDRHRGDVLLVVVLASTGLGLGVAVIAVLRPCVA